MIDLADFKKSLGKSASEMTDEEILRLRELQDQLAEILFSLWNKKDTSKKAHNYE